MTPVSLQTIINSRALEAAPAPAYSHRLKRLTSSRKTEKAWPEMKCGAVSDAPLPRLQPHPQTR
jgi:hypothetical protein